MQTILRKASRKKKMRRKRASDGGVDGDGGDIKVLSKDAIKHLFFDMLQDVEQQLMQKWLEQKITLAFEYNGSFCLLHKFDRDFLAGSDAVANRYHLDFIHTPLELRKQGHASRLMRHIVNHFDLSSFPFSEESIHLFRKFKFRFIGRGSDTMPFVFRNKNYTIK